MSDTPETDYETNHKSFIYTMSGLPTDVVHVEFARKLERERDVAQKAMGDARDVLLDAMPDANAPTKILAEMIVAERDRCQERADELVDRLLVRLGATQERKIDAERERDILKKHISIMDISHKTANDEYFKLAVENENLERERDLWKLEAERWRDWKMS